MSVFSEKRRQEVFWPGNYPLQVWPKIRELLGEGDPEAYFQYVTQTEAIRSVPSPYFILADIDGFTGFCEKNRDDPDAVVQLLTSFFGLAGAQIHLYKGQVLKYIGDAVFAMAQDEQSARMITRNLLARYKDHIKENARFGTGLVVMVTKPDVVLMGFIGGGGAYLDYSYWGDQVNKMFHLSKQDNMVNPDLVNFVNPDGTVQFWD